MKCVIDCSAAASLFLPDEGSDEVASFIADGHTHLIVPSLCWYEITNVLHVAVKRKRLHHPEVLKIIDLFDSLGLTTDNTDGSLYSHRIYDIAHTYHLSAYDASCLELALRHDCMLLSLDEELIHAAKLAGVKIAKLN